MTCSNNYHKMNGDHDFKDVIDVTVILIANSKPTNVL